MRFLLECVGCCMMSTTTSGDASSENLSPPATPRTEETRSLVSRATVSRRRRRTSSSTADWRPSLFAISEDNAVPVGPKKAVEDRNRPAKVAVVKPAGSRNVNKRCAPSSVRVNAHSRPHEFGHNPLPMVVPTFSAAPFMF